MKSQTNSNSNNNSFTPSECHSGKSINPNNYYFNGSAKVSLASSDDAAI